MSEIICNMILQEHIFSDKDNNYFNIIHKSESIFNKLNKDLLRKEIEFDNIFTEEKKDDEEKKVIYANFIINNLLNILNKKDMIFDLKKINDLKDHQIEKKKINKYQNHLLDTINFLENIKNSRKQKIEEVSKILKSKKLLNRLVKNKNEANQIKEINNTGIIKNLDLKKLKHHSFQEKINSFNINKKDEKKIFFFADLKKNTNSLYSSKSINKIDNIITRKNSLQIFDKKECVKSSIEPLISKESENSIKWKKLISDKILLSIFNKKNQAEIYLKPESLGSLHIIINMKNNVAKLKFISKYNKVRIFLDSYIPFLRNSLTKNGIKLEEFNIFSSLKNKEFNIHKNIYFSNTLKNKKNIYEKEIDYIKYKKIDVYV